MVYSNAEPNSFPIAKLLRPEEVAEILSVSRSYAYALLQTGELPAVRIGRSVRIRPQDLQDYITANITQNN